MILGIRNIIIRLSQNSRFSKEKEIVVMKLITSKQTVNKDYEINEIYEIDKTKTNDVNEINKIK